MARFYVGQRVRIVAGENPLMPGMEGAEAIFRHYGPPESYRLAASDDCVIEMRDGLWGVSSDQLEPIQDPGHQVISWEEMADLWTPEKVGA